MADRSSSDLLKESHVRTALLSDKGCDAKLISWDLEDFTVGVVNFCSVIKRVKITYSLNDQHYYGSYVIKLSPQNHEEIFVELSNSEFSKESFFYLEILPLLTSILKESKMEHLKVPNCLMASVDKRKEMVILEDLHKRDFKMHTSKLCLDIPHANLALRELAKLHASSYLLQVMPPVVHLRALRPDVMAVDRRFQPFLEEFVSSKMVNAQRVLQEIGGYEKAIDWIQRNTSKCTDIMYEDLESINSPFSVVCHGDAWNNNFLFRYNDEHQPIEVILLDFQNCHISSLASELTMFMYMTLDGATRKTHTKSLLASYYSHFKTVVESSGFLMPFTLSEMQEEFKKKLVRGFMAGIITVPWLINGEERFPWYDGPKNDVTQREKYTEEVKTRTLRMLHSNMALRQRFLSTFDDMIEAGVI